MGKVFCSGPEVRSSGAHKRTLAETGIGGDPPIEYRSSPYVLGSGYPTGPTFINEHQLGSPGDQNPDGTTKYSMSTYQRPTAGGYTLVVTAVTEDDASRDGDNNVVASPYGG